MLRFLAQKFRKIAYQKHLREMKNFLSDLKECVAPLDLPVDTVFPSMTWEILNFLDEDEESGSDFEDEEDEWDD